MAEVRWPVFAIFTYFVLALDAGLKDLLGIGSDGIGPGFMLIFMVFVASMAQRNAVLWASLLIGLLVDLSLEYPIGNGVSVIVGPNALGYLLGGILAYELRSMIYRRHPLTMPLLTLAAGLTAQVVAVFIISFRHLLANWIPAYALEWSTTDELVNRFLMILYSALIALPLGWLLTRLAPLFGFNPRARMNYIG